jgi:hypothetical protein
VTQKRKAFNTQKQDSGESLKKKRESKVMHGQSLRSKDRELIDEEDRFLWLSRGDLKGET